MAVNADDSTCRTTGTPRAKARFIMKTVALLALPLTLAALSIGCSEPPAAPGAGEDNQTAAPAADDTTPATPAPSTDPAPAPTTDPAPTTPAIATAKVHAAPVWSYALTADAIWVATGAAVEKTGLDGTTPAPVPSLAKAYVLGTDGTRIYGLIDKGSSGELYSLKADGTEGARHFNWNWNNGTPASLNVNASRLYFGVARFDKPSQSFIGSAPAVPPIGGGSASWNLEEYVDAGTIPPAFNGDRLFAVDYHRQSTVRVSTTDQSKSVDIIRQSLPLASGGLAIDATDIYTRTTKGIVKVPVGAGASTEPTVVVPSSACPLFDPADGSESVLEDTVAIDGTTLYVACRAGANVEIRSYQTNGTLVKAVATTPYTGGVTHLKVTATAVYWQSRVAATSSDDELWRAGK